MAWSQTTRQCVQLGSCTAIFAGVHLVMMSVMLQVQSCIQCMFLMWSQRAFDSSSLRDFLLVPIAIR